jgi:glycosyltransferase involved in cell wall biosynthesis
MHCNHLDTIPYADAARGLPIILDTHNLLFVFYRKMAQTFSPLWRLLSNVEASRLRSFERKSFAAAAQVWVCSRDEQMALAPLGLGGSIRVVPNGVDTSYFHPANPDPPDNGPPVVVFTGAMGYAPNSDGVMYFIREILKPLRKRVPGVRFRVVGKDPSDALVRVSREDPGVEITGAVPDVRPFVWTSDAYVVPLRLGAGTRLKVLEAFAMGVPVVSTTQGAEGIDAEPGQHFLLADTPDAFAESVASLLARPAKVSRMVREARALVESRYSWSHICENAVASYPLTAMSSPESKS